MLLASLINYAHFTKYIGYYLSFSFVSFYWISPIRDGFFQVTPAIKASRDKVASLLTVNS